MTVDCLQVSGIRVYGYTGFASEEQVLGQWYEVDLTFWLDLSKAGRSDRLEDTHDYASSIKLIQELIKTARFKLIESLAEAIAETVLEAGGIEQVRVRLTKVNPPIPDFDGKISLEITRPKNYEYSSSPLD